MGNCAAERGLSGELLIDVDGIEIPAGLGVKVNIWLSYQLGQGGQRFALF